MNRFYAAQPGHFWRQVGINLAVSSEQKLFLMNFMNLTVIG
jgi:hypothetical protein